jgi:hypothetical protein
MARRVGSESAPKVWSNADAEYLTIWLSIIHAIGLVKQKI